MSRSKRAPKKANAPAKILGRCLTSIIVIDVREVGGHRDRRLRERMKPSASCSSMSTRIFMVGRDYEPLAVVRAVIARHDRLARETVE